MKALGVVFAAALLLAPASARADDPYDGWTRLQLEVRILQLQSQNADLRSKLASAEAAAAADAPAPKAKRDLLLDDFEGATAVNGRSWWAGCDGNSLGTTLEPQPFVPSPGGSPLSPGHCGRVHGHFGKNVAPWPWALLNLPLNDPDLRGYGALSFYVKGDGGHYRVQLCRAAVKDFAFHEADFDAPQGWTKVTLPLAGFVQPAWGKSVPADFQDVEKISFSPTTSDADYDLSIDDLKLLK